MDRLRKLRKLKITMETFIKNSYGLTRMAKSTKLTTGQPKTAQFTSATSGKTTMAAFTSPTKSQN